MVLPLALALFEYVNVLVALFAVFLAIKWQKTEFIAGLLLLLLYTVIDAIELTLSAILDVNLINASQFGFILLALVAFIAGMRPAEPIMKPA